MIFDDAVGGVFGIVRQGEVEGVETVRWASDDEELEWSGESGSVDISLLLSGSSMWVIRTPIEEYIAIEMTHHRT